MREGSVGCVSVHKPPFFADPGGERCCHGYGKFLRQRTCRLLCQTRILGTQPAVSWLNTGAISTDSDDRFLGAISTCLLLQKGIEQVKVYVTVRLSDGIYYRAVSTDLSSEAAPYMFFANPFTGEVEQALDAFWEILLKLANRTVFLVEQTSIQFAALIVQSIKQSTELAAKIAWFFSAPYVGCGVAKSSTVDWPLIMLLAAAGICTVRRRGKRRGKK